LPGLYRFLGRKSGRAVVASRLRRTASTCHVCGGRALKPMVLGFFGGRALGAELPLLRGRRYT